MRSRIGRDEPGDHTPRGRYDRDMIRDFLNHLLWELRTAVFDYRQRGRGTSAGHPELDEVLDRYFQGYGVGLLPLTVFDHRGANLDQVRAARRMAAATLPALRQEQLRLLEALLPLFDEALQCADPALWGEDQVPTHVIESRKMPGDDRDQPPGRLGEAE